MGWKEIAIVALGLCRELLVIITKTRVDSMAMIRAHGAVYRTWGPQNACRIVRHRKRGLKEIRKRLVDIEKAFHELDSSSSEEDETPGHFV